MSKVRVMLKIASWVILAIGLGGALYELLTPILFTDWYDLPQQFGNYIPRVALIAMVSIFVAGALRLLVSIDERLEQFLSQAHR
ncbi:MAG TPA: hypothetical protein VG407_01835 [Caulobacteraceae bacterium]|jgi:hypothetical protein|nr:hypothetical protein [Caulobacteraceae bacterium]